MFKMKSGYFYIFACTVLFSFVEVVLKAVAGVFAPLQITLLRFVLGGTMLLPFALIAAACLLLGVYSEPLMQILRAIAI